MKVLVIEDDSSIARTIAIFFHKRGIETSIAQTEAAAIEAMTKNSPDLILADWKIQDGVDCIQLCRDLLEISPGASVVFMTAAPLNELRAACVDLQPLAILPKSFGSYELVTNILCSMNS